MTQNEPRTVNYTTRYDADADRWRVGCENGPFFVPLWDKRGRMRGWRTRDLAEAVAVRLNEKATGSAMVTP